MDQPFQFISGLKTDRNNPPELVNLGVLKDPRFWSKKSKNRALIWYNFELKKFKNRVGLWIDH